MSSFCNCLTGHKCRYDTKRIDPSSPVGAISAQSLGEPGTQMTLKTFHFAGVASMNVTLGVPRIKEIINAAKTISTPIMHVQLEVDRSEVAARMVKGRLETTTLGEVCKHIKMVLSNKDPCLMVTLDMNVICSMELSVNAFTVKCGSNFTHLRHAFCYQSHPTLSICLHRLSHTCFQAVMCCTQHFGPRLCFDFCVLVFKASNRFMRATFRACDALPCLLCCGSMYVPHLYCSG